MTVTDGGNEAEGLVAGPTSRRRWHRPRNIPAVGQWILLLVAAALLLRWVEPTAIESPYNGF